MLKKLADDLWLGVKANQTGDSWFSQSYLGAPREFSRG